MQAVDLRGAVLLKFRSLAEFSTAIGWGYGKTCRIVHGQQLPDSSDIREFCQTVGLDDPDTIVRLFSLA